MQGTQIKHIVCHFRFIIELLQSQYGTRSLFDREDPEALFKKPSPAKSNAMAAPTHRPCYGERAVAVVHMAGELLGRQRPWNGVRKKKKKDFLVHENFQALGI